jgi:DNA repair exonuclease SbcCD ATPase subunit
VTSFENDPLAHPAGEPSQEPESASAPSAAPEELSELDQLRLENEQLRGLCVELEQALHEASQHHEAARSAEERLADYEALVEEKNEMIRKLAQELQETQAALQELDANGRNPEPAAPKPHTGPVPREEELLALSEELERERRQLQDDEQALMEQMREMEVGMARERAELSRQRNDLQRLQIDIRNDLEKLSRSGGPEMRINELRSRLQDVSNRRGAAPGQAPATHTNLPPVQPAPQPAPPAPPSKRDSLLGRFFGK